MVDWCFLQISEDKLTTHSWERGTNFHLKKTQSHLKSQFSPQMTFLTSHQNFQFHLKSNFLFTLISNICFKKFSRSLKFPVSIVASIFFYLYRPLQILLACFRWLKVILDCFRSFQVGLVYFTSFITLVSTLILCCNRFINIF